MSTVHLVEVEVTPIFHIEKDGRFQIVRWPTPLPISDMAWDDFRATGADIVFEQLGAQVLANAAGPPTSDPQENANRLTERTPEIDPDRVTKRETEENSNA